MTAANLEVLVLGATGIIGSEVCRVASETGHRVTAVSRRGGAVGTLQSSSLRTVAADAQDTESLRSALGDARFDVVVDLVSFQPSTLRSLLSTFERRCGQYLFVSSATVYEEPADGTLTTEDSATVASGWSYPLHKLECERLLRSQGLPYTVARPYITYSEQRLPFGIWESSDVLSRIATGAPVAIGDKIAPQTTSVCHASDVARAFVALMGNERAVGETLTVASPEATTWLEVYQTAAKVVGGHLSEANVPLAVLVEHFPELAGKAADRSRRRQFDLSKLYGTCPGFNFEVSLEDGYRRALEARLSPKVRAATNFSIQGRMDRLLAQTTHQRAYCSLPKMGPQMAPLGTRKAAAYAIGRVGPLRHLAQASRRLLRADHQSETTGNYGLSSSVTT